MSTTDLNTSVVNIILNDKINLPDQPLADTSQVALPSGDLASESPDQAVMSFELQHDESLNMWGDEFTSNDGGLLP